MAKDDSGFPLPVQLVQEVDRLFDELIHRPWGSTRSSANLWNPEVDSTKQRPLLSLKLTFLGFERRTYRSQ